MAAPRVIAYHCRYRPVCKTSAGPLMSLHFARKQPVVPSNFNDFAVLHTVFA
jgi:hypothetical protein